METQRHSWHSVNRVRVNERRCCVSNYYFSPHPPGGSEHYHVTTFSARPEQPVQRILIQADALVRNALRKVVRQGIGRTDLYDPNN
jgi:hypothetical protein